MTSRIITPVYPVPELCVQHRVGLPENIKAIDGSAVTVKDSDEIAGLPSQ